MSYSRSRIDYEIKGSYGLYILYLLIPPVTIYNNIGSINNVILQLKDLPTVTYTLVRLFALYGISLLFIQILLGSNMIFFIQIFGPKILKFHIMEGIIAYALILSHPILFAIYSVQTLGLQQAVFTVLIGFENDRQKYMLLGKAGLLLLTVGVMAGILREKIGSNWRMFHRINYIVFPLIMIHSWFIGTDSRTISFTFLYILFALGYLYSVSRKIFSSLKKTA